MRSYWICNSEGCGSTNSNARNACWMCGQSKEPEDSSKSKINYKVKDPCPDGNRCILGDICPFFHSDEPTESVPLSQLPEDENIEFEPTSIYDPSNVDDVTATKIQERCPDWPNCSFFEFECPFVHPYKDCLEDIECHNKSNCLYIHKNEERMDLKSVTKWVCEVEECFAINVNNLNICWVCKSARGSEINSISVKVEERCPDWPICKLPQNLCPFIHPTKPCNKYKKCKADSSCLYIHPTNLKPIENKTDTAKSELWFCKNSKCMACNKIITDKCWLCYTIKDTSEEILCKEYPYCILGDEKCLFRHPKSDHSKLEEIKTIEIKEESEKRELRRKRDRSQETEKRHRSQETEKRHHSQETRESRKRDYKQEIRETVKRKKLASNNHSDEMPSGYFSELLNSMKFVNQLKIDEMCPDFPTCPYTKEECVFLHPSYMCVFSNQCSKLKTGTCLGYHINCGLGENCLHTSCVLDYELKSFIGKCPDWPSCFNGEDCLFTHSKNLCKWGLPCTTSKDVCVDIHRECIYGQNCTKGNWCQFSHPGIDDKVEEKCPDWPDCDLDDFDCPYVHPKLYCGEAENCQNKEKCLRLHMVCKSKSDCTDNKCLKYHYNRDFASYYGSGLFTNPEREYLRYQQVVMNPVKKEEKQKPIQPVERRHSISDSNNAPEPGPIPPIYNPQLHAPPITPNFNMQNQPPPITPNFNIQNPPPPITPNFNIQNPPPPITPNFNMQNPPPPNFNMQNPPPLPPSSRNSSPGINEPDYTRPLSRNNIPSSGEPAYKKSKLKNGVRKTRWSSPDSTVEKDPEVVTEKELRKQLAKPGPGIYRIPSVCSVGVSDQEDFLLAISTAISLQAKIKAYADSIGDIKTSDGLTDLLIDFHKIQDMMIGI